MPIISSPGDLLLWVAVPAVFVSLIVFIIRVVGVRIVVDRKDR